MGSQYGSVVSQVVVRVRDRDIKYDPSASGLTGFDSCGPRRIRAKSGQHLYDFYTLRSPGDLQWFAL